MGWFPFLFLVIKNRRKRKPIPSVFLSLRTCALVCFLFFLFYYLNAIVVTALTANAVASGHRVAIGAFYKGGRSKLRVAACAGVSSLFGNFWLRYCHLFLPHYYLVSLSQAHALAFLFLPHTGHSPLQFSVQVNTVGRERRIASSTAESMTKRLEKYVYESSLGREVNSSVKEQSYSRFAGSKHLKHSPERVYVISQSTTQL